MGIGLAEIDGDISFKVRLSYKYKDRTSWVPIDRNLMSKGGKMLPFPSYFTLGRLGYS